MKNLIITTMLLIIWAGLFSQQSNNQLNAGKYAGISHNDMTGHNASSKSYHPSGFVDYLVEWAPGAHVPGLSVCVLKNGELYWVHHFGLANIAQNIPVDDSSCFYIASISKTVVQTAIMQLWEQDIFELDDYVGNYLTFPVINPYYPDSAITFRQLMTHTSSVKDNYSGEWPFNQFMPGYFTPGGTYYYPTNFYNTAPGTQWNYTNVGNSLLGYLTQEMAEQDYSEYCEEHIFQPLGINNGSYYLANLNPANLVTQYIYSGGTYNPVNTPDGGGPIYPAAVLKISAIELSKFLSMYIQQGTFNDSTILSPETIELITTPSLVTPYVDLQCLTWRIWWGTQVWHSGGTNFASTFMAYDKVDKWGFILLMNSSSFDAAFLDVISNAFYFASLYNPISVASIAVNDTDGDQVIEANEEFGLGLTLRNDMNFPNIAENIMATISVNSPFVTLISDSLVSLGTLDYLDEIQLPADQFLFSVSENLEPGNIEFQLHFIWDEGNEYTTTFSLFGGHADVLLVRDEESVSVAWLCGIKQIQDYYLQSLDSLGYSTHYWDMEVRGDPDSAFINNFPAVIWFTGSDAENTLSENNQILLSEYLDNGGKLFVSGQNISDELEGTDFLGNYLHVEHLQDTWGGNSIIGIENDPIGNGQQYNLNTSDALFNQYSKSVVDTLEGANYVFRYVTTTMKGAAVRYENSIYKTVFFAFGFEAINGFENRSEILYRILNDYFQVIVGTDDQPIIETTGINLNVFPNPSSTFTTFSYTLNQKSSVKLDIYDINGQLIKTVVNESQEKGEQHVSFKSVELKPGVYFCMLKTNEGIQTKKMIKLD